MQPIGENILAKPYPSEEMSEGGIFVPESYRKISDKMLVVEVGSKVKRKKGETIFRVNGKGDEVMINGELHFLINENAILATA